jgi:hypothetical protein
MLLCCNELFVVLAGIRSLSLNVRYRGNPDNMCSYRALLGLNPKRTRRPTGTPPRAILAQLEVAHRLPGAPMKRSIPRGANIGPSSGRTGEILVSRKVGGTSLAEIGRGGSRATPTKTY